MHNYDGACTLAKYQVAVSDKCKNSSRWGKDPKSGLIIPSLVLFIQWDENPKDDYDCYKMGHRLNYRKIGKVKL